MSLAIRSALGIILLVIAELVLVGLGTWQLQRLEYKKQIIAEIAEQDVAPALQVVPNPLAYYANVKLSGKLDYNKPIYLYRLDSKGKPGYDLILPLVRDDGVVLVKFPLKTLEQVKSETDSDFTPSGKLLPFAKKSYFTPYNNTQKKQWYYLDVAELEQYAGYKLVPAIISDDPISIRNDHLIYAFTWYGLALICFIIWLVKSTTKDVN